MAQNVTDFGAVGDGSTDDTQAIRDAADAAGSGGTVYFPSGTYLVGSNTNYPFDYPMDGSWDNLTWKGEDFSSTKLLMASNQGGWHMMFRARDSSHRLTDVTFKHLDIDMNKQGQDQSAGFGSHFFRIYDATGTIRMQDCIVQNTMADGLKTNDAMDVDIDYCTFNETGVPSLFGAHAINPNPGSSVTITVDYTLFLNSAGSDIDVGSDSNNDYVTVNVNRCYSEGSAKFLKIDPENDLTTVTNSKFVGGSSSAMESGGIVANNDNYECGSLALDNVVIEGPIDRPGLNLGAGTDISAGAMQSVTLNEVHVSDVDNKGHRSAGSKTGTGIYAEGVDLGSSGTVSVANVGPNNEGDALYFWDGASGSINEVIHNGTAEIGDTGGVSVGTNSAGGSNLSPDVATKSDCGPRSSSTDSTSTDSTSDSTTDSTSSSYGGYNTPGAGTVDWHVPLNENFETIEADIKDLVSRLDNLESQ